MSGIKGGVQVGIGIGVGIFGFFGSASSSAPFSGTFIPSLFACLPSLFACLPSTSLPFHRSSRPFLFPFPLLLPFRFPPPTTSDIFSLREPWVHSPSSLLPPFPIGMRVLSMVIPRPHVLRFGSWLYIPSALRIFSFLTNGINNAPRFVDIIPPPISPPFSKGHPTPCTPPQQTFSTPYLWPSSPCPSLFL